MMSRVFAVTFAVLLPWTASAADYPVSFGEVKNGVVIPGRTLKMCAKTTGYTYGFEVLLPETGSHEVSGDLYWPTNDNCVSCAHAMDSYGKHTGRFLKRLSFDGDEKPGDYRLIVIVDREPVATVRFKVEAAASCP